MTTPFEVLGVDEDADAEAVEQAYKDRVKEAHPDHGGSAAEFKRVRAAYEALRDGARPGDADQATPGDGGAGRPGPPSTGPGPSANGAAPGRNGASAGQAGRQDEEQKTTVEYLNYEVLDDHGWDLEDDDLFASASDADLGMEDYGRFIAEPDETLLEAAEERGFAWPFACRGAACANCAVLVTEGELSMPSNHVLPEEMLERGIQLSCVGTPTTEDLRVVYNVKHLPELEELRLPPTPFKRAYPDHD